MAKNLCYTSNYCRIVRPRSFLILILLCASIFYVSGCATKSVARPKGFPEGVLDGKQSSEFVTLVNSQMANEFVEIGTAGMGRSLHGNLTQWTDSAIELLREKLTESGVTVTDKSSKTISLTITDAKMSTTAGGWGFKCAVTLRVEYAEVIRENFVGERGSWKYIDVCDAGIAEAVANLLRDEKMQRYLGY